MTTFIVPAAASIVTFAPETRERVRTILSAGIADNTRRAYVSDLRHF